MELENFNCNETQKLNNEKKKIKNCDEPQNLNCDETHKLKL